MIRGTFHGGNRTYPQSGALRPAPGWAAHRMPIPGLYQTGRHDASGRLDHGRAGPQRRDRAAAATSDTTSRRWCAVPDARVQSAIDHWAPRFVQGGVDYNDFVAHGRRASSAGRTGSTPGARSATRTRARGEAETATAQRRPPARRGCAPPSPTTSRKFVWVVDARRAAATWPTAAVAALYAAHEHARPDGRADRDAARRRPRRRQPAPARAVSSARRSCCSSPASTPRRRSSSRSRTSSCDAAWRRCRSTGPARASRGYDLPIRPDYEVAGGRVLDALDGRDDLDLERVGALGVSLGGYYAPRAAAFEPRIKAGRRDQRRRSTSARCGTHLPELTRETFAHKSFATDDDEARERALRARPRRRARSGSTARRCSSPAGTTG